jgi:hypothetical protein
MATKNIKLEKKRQPELDNKTHFNYRMTSTIAPFLPFDGYEAVQDLRPIPRLLVGEWSAQAGDGYHEGVRVLSRKYVNLNPTVTIDGADQSDYHLPHFDNNKDLEDNNNN